MALMEERLKNMKRRNIGYNMNRDQNDMKFEVQMIIEKMTRPKRN